MFISGEQRPSHFYLIRFHLVSGVWLFGWTGLSPTTQARTTERSRHQLFFVQNMLAVQRAYRTHREQPTLNHLFRYIIDAGASYIRAKGYDPGPQKMRCLLLYSAYHASASAGRGPNIREPTLIGEPRRRHECVVAFVLEFM